MCVCENVCAEMGAITALFGHSWGHDLLMRKEIRFSFGIMVKIISRLGHCRVCVQSRGPTINSMQHLHLNMTFSQLVTVLTDGKFVFRIIAHCD